MNEVRSPVGIYVLDSSASVTGAFVCAGNIAALVGDRARVMLAFNDRFKIKNEALTFFDGVFPLTIINLRRRLLSIALYLPALLVSSWRLKRRMTRDNATILIINDFYLMHGLVIRLLGFRGKLITWVRIHPSAFPLPLSKLWLRATAIASSEIVAVSLYIQKALPKFIKSEVIYDSVVTEQATTSKSYVCYSGKLTIVYIGNYIHGKGQDRAIEAFARIASNFPTAELHFFGSDMGLRKNASYKANLQSAILKYSLDSCVHLHDFTDEPRLILESCFLALNFSKSESFSMTCLEASAAGVPVIATRCGGPEEIIQDQMTGILVDVDDVSAMACAMARLLADPALASAMGARAAARVSVYFSRGVHRAQLSKLLGLQPD